jgi:hypothetical protein
VRVDLTLRAGQRKLRVESLVNSIVRIHEYGHVPARPLLVFVFFVVRTSLADRPGSGTSKKPAFGALSQCVMKKTGAAGASANKCQIVGDINHCMPDFE